MLHFFLPSHLVFQHPIDELGDGHAVATSHENRVALTIFGIVCRTGNVFALCVVLDSYVVDGDRIVSSKISQEQSQIVRWSPAFAFEFEDRDADFFALEERS